MSSSGVRKGLVKSASVIIVSGTAGGARVSPPGQNYKLLFLKRNSQMRVAPGHSVFPGGKLDPHIDASPRWLDIFKPTSSQRGAADLKTLFAGLITPNSIGRAHESLSSTSLPLEIAYRLCAIRETFEETGILIARRANPDSASPSLTSELFGGDRDETEAAIGKWHDRVLDDSAKFIDMFLELNNSAADQRHRAPLVPDVFGLHEWANWITPTREKTRFDTFFFTCFLSQVPPQTLIRVNKQENESLEYLSPFEVIEKYKRGEIKFIPPQLYETHRLARFETFEKLAEYSLHRQKYGLEPWLPKFSKNWKIGVLPGDYMYDRADGEWSDTDWETDDKKSGNGDGGGELKSQAPNRLNRVLHGRDEKTGMNRYEIMCNFDVDVRSKYFHSNVLQDPVQDCSSTPTTSS